jgi:hypothetical protein
MVAACLATAANGAVVFNGAGENQTDAHGYYYVISGGKFQPGQTVNGDNASGGTMRYLVDDPAWGPYPLGTWQKDDWFPANAGFALTLKNGASTVYDNNGLENNTYGDYYDASGSTGIAGLVRGYSMSNNFDWIYAGYVLIGNETTFDTLIGYFDGNGGAADPVPFNPLSSYIQYRMNLWSNVMGDLLPVNTGGFFGNVFTSDNKSGTFAASYTGVDRVLPDTSTDPIWRLTYTLDTPITLQPGVYWFSHDAALADVPEPGAFLQLLSLGAIFGGGYGFRRFRWTKS